MPDTLKLSQIIIDRDERQRQLITGIEELAESIRKVGLITPIAITRGKRLVAGERRLSALKLLDIKTLEHAKHFIYLDEMSSDMRYLAELEENVRRSNLTWQEQCDAVARYHEMQSEANRDWSQDETAKRMGFSQAYVSQAVTVAKAAEKNPAIYDIDRMKAAYNLVSRAEQRKAQAVREKLVYGDIAPPAAPQPSSPSSPPPAPIYNGSFQDWAAGYEGLPFNFLHCDLPYGIDFDKSPGMNRNNIETYEDSFANYQRLLSDLEELPISSDAHIMFWFSPKHYTYTLNALRDLGWAINDYPLIWFRSDNSGIIPSASREGRRVYEMAFYGYRGDAVLRQPLANLFGCGRGETEHASTKPLPMLQHFFKMFVDETTRMLDPTCGSGNALVAAREHGAEIVQGVELSSDYYLTACNNWNKKRITL